MPTQVKKKDYFCPTIKALIIEKRCKMARRQSLRTVFGLADSRVHTLCAEHARCCHGICAEERIRMGCQHRAHQVRSVEPCGHRRYLPEGPAGQHNAACITAGGQNQPPALGKRSDKHSQCPALWHADTHLPKHASGQAQFPVSDRHVQQQRYHVILHQPAHRQHTAPQGVGGLAPAMEATEDRRHARPIASADKGPCRHGTPESAYGGLAQPVAEEIGVHGRERSHAEEPVL